MAKSGKTILVVASVLNEDTGEVEDSHVTRVTGQDDAGVTRWKQGFAAFGAAQVQEGLAAGVSKDKMHMHRHKGSKHGAWPK